ncbi:MAG: YdcF family protein [Methyloprofundus sp.]|nr:YdcF family protein [Methyloprofundus sp.]
MSLLVIFTSFFCGLLCQYFKWHKAKNMLFAGIALAMILMGVGIAPNYLLTKLQAPYEERAKINWLTDNVIVLLGASTQALESGIEPSFFGYGRLTETVRLYKDCVQHSTQCHIIVSGGDAAKNGEAESSVYRRYLLDLGVAVADISEESNSMNTWQNAEFTSAMIKAKTYDTIILLSSGLHCQRSELYFAHFGIKTQPVRADYMSAKLSIMPLWYNFAVMDFALHEWMGLYRYFIYNYMGWSAKRVNAGDA